MAFLLIYSAHDNKRSDKLLIGVVIFGEIHLSVPQRLSGVIEIQTKKTDNAWTVPTLIICLNSQRYPKDIITSQ